MLLLCSELRPHFSLASESDPADQDDVDDDGEPDRNSTHQSRAPPVTTHDDTVVTSGVSTLSSTVSHESHNAHHSVSMELGRMKLETNRYTVTAAEDVFTFASGKKKNNSLSVLPLACLSPGCWNSCWRRRESTSLSCNTCWRRESKRSDY